MATTTFAPVRAIRRPRRIDLRAALGLFVMLVAAVGMVIAWNGAARNQAVLVATRDLPAGATLSASDLGVAHLRSDDAAAAVALPASDEDQIVGKPLTEPVHAQQVLVRAQLSPRPPLAPGQVALSIPLAADAAVGGRLRSGDVVRVYATTAKGTPQAATSIVVDRATVLEVGAEQRLGVVGSGSATGPSPSVDPSALRSITLALTPQQAHDLAFARWNGELDVALLPPGTPEGSGP